MMQNALPKKRSIDTILEAVFLAVIVAFVIALGTYILAVFIVMRFSGAAWVPVFVLRLSLAIGVVSALVTSYKYVIKRSDAKSRVRQVCTITGLLIASAFVFSWYQVYQDTLLVRDICIQYDQAIEKRDYETAYELMSPRYRQTHTITRFIEDDVKLLGTCEPSYTDYIVEVSIGARVASIIPYPLGSLNTKIILEQVSHKWYFTGEFRHFPA